MMSNEKTFAINETVKWTSSAAGTTKTKRGDVVAGVPSWVSVHRRILLTELLGESWQSKYKPMLDSTVSLLPRDDVSYLVAVPTKSGRGKLKLYWPRVSQLRKVDSDEQPTE